MNFKQKYDSFADLVNKALEEYVTEKDTPEGTIYKAMKYSLMAGGKRLRPVLSLSVCEILGGEPENVIPYACAVEMIHTYSLIHDDLPAMDNDDYRRGRLTSHKVFGEAIAVLAGDALLNYAFEIMLEDVLKKGGDTGIKVMDIVAKAAGVSGMIGGQVVDLESEGKGIPVNILEYMHRCKTGALIKASVMLSAALCGTNKKKEECLEEYAEKIGLAFQIKDDILDVEGDFKDLGKATGSDAANGKTTFATIYGVERSREILTEVISQAVYAVKREFGDEAEFLVNLAEYIASRES